MAHYALLDENNIVVNVFVGEDKDVLIDGKTPEEYYTEKYGQKCLQTSYNGSIRKNYAGIGMKYSEELDAFITEQPYPSWTLNENADWVAPIPEPVEWNPIPHFWNEDTGQWEIEPYFKNSVTIQNRVLVCNSCPFWTGATAMCTKCGCPGKTLHTNPNAVCPEGKW